MRSAETNKESYQVRFKGRTSAEQHLGSELESGKRVPCQESKTRLQVQVQPRPGLIVGRRTRVGFFLARARRRQDGAKFRQGFGAHPPTPPTLAEMGQVQYGWTVMDVCWALDHGFWRFLSRDLSGLFGKFRAGIIWFEPVWSWTTPYGLGSCMGHGTVWIRVRGHGPQSLALLPARDGAKFI